MKRCNNCLVFNSQSKRLLKAGDYLFQDGDKASEAFLVNSGVIKVSKVTENGSEYIVELKKSGDKIALVNMYEQKTMHNFNAVALTDCEVLVVDVNHYNNISCNVKECILESCYETLLKINNFRNSVLYEDDVSKKIMKLLNYLYEYFGLIEQNKRVINLPFNRSELCHLIGVRRETFSRKLSQMAKEGIIKLEKSKIILKK